MASSVPPMRTRMSTRASLAILGVGGAALLLTACSGSPSAANASETALRSHVCTQADVGPDFRQENAGDFSPSNLAGLASDPAQRKRELESAGLTGGYFAYWKHNVSDPPFEPPLEIVCQALEFSNPEQAAAFVANLRPTPEALVSTALAWIPESNRSVTEQPLDNAAGTHARAFRLTASDTEQSVALEVVFQPSGRFVQSVYAGGPGSTEPLANVEALASLVAARATNSASPGTSVTSATP